VSDDVRVAAPERRPDQLSWAELRPVLVGGLIAADSFVVVLLAIARPEDWWAPFTAFSMVLVGAVVLFVWSMRHRGDG
jgi:hypothetical protein